MSNSVYSEAIDLIYKDIQVETGWTLTTQLIRDVLMIMLRVIRGTGHIRLEILVLTLPFSCFLPPLSWIRRPLFSPCKCSGSIGLVHQDCLMSWLEVTRRDGELPLGSHFLSFQGRILTRTPYQGVVSFVKQNSSLIHSMQKIRRTGCPHQRLCLDSGVDSLRSGCLWVCE